MLLHINPTSFQKIFKTAPKSNLNIFKIIPQLDGFHIIPKYDQTYYEMDSAHNFTEIISTPLQDHYTIRPKSKENNNHIPKGQNHSLINLIISQSHHKLISNTPQHLQRLSSNRFFVRSIDRSLDRSIEGVTRFAS